MEPCRKPLSAYIIGLIIENLNDRLIAVACRFAHVDTL